MQHTINIHTFTNTILLCTYVYMCTYIDNTYTYRLAMLLGSAEWLLGFLASGLPFASFTAAVIRLQQTVLTAMEAAVKATQRRTQ